MNTRDPRFRGAVFVIVGMILRFSTVTHYWGTPDKPSINGNGTEVASWTGLYEFGLICEVIGVGLILIGFLVAALRPPAE